MVRLPDKRSTYVDEVEAANYLRDNKGAYNGLTYEQVKRAHNDPSFLESLRMSGCGGIHMAENDAHKERLYVSLCHRHYTTVGLRETISAQEKHAFFQQKEANRRLQEHGEFMAEESYGVGKIDGFVSGHKQGLEAKKAPLFGDVKVGDFAGGFVDTFRWVGVTLVVLVIAVVYMAYGKGKG